jgi:hypothetical protein
MAGSLVTKYYPGLHGSIDPSDLELQLDLRLVPFVFAEELMFGK